jgi:hypothetical protein
MSAGVTSPGGLERRSSSSAICCEIPSKPTMRALLFKLCAARRRSVRSLADSAASVSSKLSRKRRTKSLASSRPRPLANSAIEALGGGRPDTTYSRLRLAAGANQNARFGVAETSCHSCVTGAPSAISGACYKWEAHVPRQYSACSFSSSEAYDSIGNVLTADRKKVRHRARGGG